MKRRVLADGKLLAIVLYKTGAFELKRLIQGLAGLPVDEPEQDKPDAKTTKAKAPSPAKGKECAKPKPPQKSPSVEKGG